MKNSKAQKNNITLNNCEAQKNSEAQKASTMPDISEQQINSETQETNTTLNNGETQENSEAQKASKTPDISKTQIKSGASKISTTQKTRIYFYILSAALIAAFFLGIVYGSVDIPLKDVLSAVFGGNVAPKTGVIVRTVRLPRVIAGTLAGAGLGTAGVIIQSVMNNSLASPNTIGVNSGAGFFVMLSMMIFPQSLIAKSVMAFVGALLTSIAILCIAYIAEKSRVTIVLAGITVSSFLSAGMNMMKILDTDISVNAMQFLIGSLSGVTMKALFYPSIGIIISIVVAVVLAKALNILSLGDGVASSIGLRVNLFRIIFVVIASVLSGLVVSFSGLIGFVGLIVPHICRYFFGHDSRVLIPAAALMGAVLVLVSDLIGRVLFAPFELPVGIILSLMGAPFFLYLLIRKGGRRVNA